jgi:hypothetical protein
VLVQKAAENPSKYPFGIDDFTHRQDALKFRQYTDTDLPRLDGELGKGQNQGHGPACIRAFRIPILDVP